MVVTAEGYVADGLQLRIGNHQARPAAYLHVPSGALIVLGRATCPDDVMTPAYGKALS